jgi:dTDP-4-dehydrorhamnose reductase
LSKILVIGGIGQIGHELARGQWSVGLTAELVERDQLDLGRPTAAKAAVVATRPRIVINAGADTAVDQAEVERDAAFAINRDGRRRLPKPAARSAPP